MQKLIAELARLYLPEHTFTSEALEKHLRGETTLALSLCTNEGLTRAMVIPFRKMADGEETRHWTRLCEAANALQTQLGLPAPAVSILGADGYGLWLSLKVPIPVAQAQTFLTRLHQAYFPDIELRADAASAALELPPCLHQGSGKWAAFIHPGLGASFAAESGLEMAPPFAGQTAFLEGLQSMSETQFRHAWNMLEQSHDTVPPAGAPVSLGDAAPDGLLLKDATLEEIVRHLHSRNIEPTFRHLIADRGNR